MPDIRLPNKAMIMHRVAQRVTVAITQRASEYAGRMGHSLQIVDFCLEGS